MWTDPILLELFRRYPAKETIFTEAAERSEEEYELEKVRPFYRWFGMSSDEMFFGKDVLDIGSGFGGTAVTYLEYGARSVVGVEVEEVKVQKGTEFAQRRGVASHVRFRRGVGEALPCNDESFDLVTLYDVLEHVISPAQTLSEGFRVLRPGGVLATAFPPYYALRTGSHLHGYACTLPGLNLLFSTRQLRSATTIYLDEYYPTWRHFLRDVATDKLWNQNGLTARSFRRLVSEHAWEVERMRYIGHHDRRISSKSPSAQRRLAPLFWFFERFASTPPFDEILCTRVCAALRKPRSSD